MWASLKEYLGILVLTWPLRVLAVAGLIGVLLDVRGDIQVPTIGWVIVVVVGLILAQFAAFHKVRLERESLRIQTTENIQRVNNYLRRGNDLRNGIIYDPKLRNKPYEGWLQDVEAWSKEVHDFLRTEFPHLEGVFTNDAGLPFPRDWEGDDARRSGLINFMERRLHRLQEIIMQLSE